MVARRAFTDVALLACAVMMHVAPARAGQHDIAFVTEHLAESAIDNRYASLPVWERGPRASKTWGTNTQGAFAHTAIGGLTLEGFLVSASITFRFSSRWSAGAFAFYDAMDFAAERDRRPLDPLFSTEIPLKLPAEAVFTALDGSARDVGLGIFFARQGEGGMLGRRRWIGGVMVQEVALRQYRLDYTVLSGPDTGASGSIDFSADYRHAVPFGGLEVIRTVGRWSFSPRVLASFTLPKRGVEGCITGANFEACGDTAEAGNGVHFGNPYLALGMGLSYDPWGLTFDIGSTVAQELVEPRVHKGIDRNLLLSFDRRF